MPPQLPSPLAAARVAGGALGICSHESVPSSGYSGKGEQQGISGQQECYLRGSKQSKKIKKKLLRTATVAGVGFSARAARMGGWLCPASHQQQSQQAVWFGGVPERA